VLRVEDLEAESRALRQRSAELVELLGVLPVVEGMPAVWAERRRLAAATHKARRTAAAKVAAGMDNPGVIVGSQPPIRRVETDWKGLDLDPFHGSPVVTPELVAFWEWQRDVLAPAYEAQYRKAATETPYSEALVAAANGHIALLRARHSMLAEGGTEVEAAVARYDQAYMNLRQGPIDAQAIAGEAEIRLASLRRIAVQAELGDDLDERGFIAAVVSQRDEVGLVDAKTGTPLVPAGT
jgi:hypothetical protein